MKNAGNYAGVFVCSFDCNVVDCIRDWEGVQVIYLNSL